MINLYIWFRFVTSSKTETPCYKGFNVLLMKDITGLVEDRNCCSCLQSKREQCDYREDARLGRISESTADYCLNYMDIRTVFISAGLSFAWRAILLGGHYLVHNHMHMFAHAHGLKVHVQDTTTNVHAVSFSPSTQVHLIALFLDDFMLSWIFCCCDAYFSFFFSVLEL